MDVTTQRYDCADAAQRAAGIEAAAGAVRRGELVVLPTDTVYGIGADAFRPAAVAALLAAKGRGRDMPPPVLVGSVRTAAALIEELGPYGQDLMDEFWPGALTLVCLASRTLSWDLGDTRGTVAVRMPLDPVALELLKEAGPMAVSSANRSGAPPATTAAGAEAQLGPSVSVYLDGGSCVSDVPSTIVDLTGPVPRLLRAGAISVQRLSMVAAVITPEETSGESAGSSGSLGGAAPAAGETRAEGDPAQDDPAEDNPAEGNGAEGDPAQGNPGEGNGAPGTPDVPATRTDNGTGNGAEGGAAAR